MEHELNLELYQQAFGKDFELGIEVPDYFEDASWKNDVCPSFSFEPIKNVRITLWVDYKEADERECGGTRYTVVQYTNDDQGRQLFETESPETILSYLTSEINPNV